MSPIVFAMVDLRAYLLALAVAYCGATGRSESHIGHAIRGRGGFIAGVRAGRSCTIDTWDAAVRWFAAHWPADTPWPDGIDRPAVPASAPETEEAAA